MEAAVVFVKAGFLAWFALLALLITLRIVTGDIRVDGLLTHSKETEGDLDMERVVAMLVFPIVLVFYAVNALNADLTVTGGRPILPDVPEYLLSLLVGSNGLYLAGKIMRM